MVEGEIQLTEVAYRRRRQLLCRISDGTGSLTLRFFYFSGVSATYEEPTAPDIVLPTDELSVEQSVEKRSCHC